MFSINTLVFSNQPLISQDLAFELGDYFLSNGNDEEAITEFKRFIFFNQGNSQVGEAYARIGLAFRNQEKWSEAITAYREAIAYALNDSVMNDCRIAIAIVMIASRNYSSAELELLRLFHFADNLVIKRKAAYFLAICQLYTFKWDDARKSLNYFFNDSAPGLSAQIDTLLWQAKNLPYKSLTLTRWLSIFLPGSGHIYAGDWRNGLNALALNSLFAYILIDAIVTGKYPDVFIGYLTLFDRYYRGSIHNAKEAALQRNEQIKKIQAQKILNYLMQIGQ